MPMPEPHDGEKQDEFMNRCMSADVMKTDFPDEKQRLAVCFRQFGEKKKAKSSENHLDIQASVEFEFLEG